MASFVHVNMFTKFGGQGEKVGSTKLFKFDSGQRGFWGILVNQNSLVWAETVQYHHIMHM